MNMNGDEFEKMKLMVPVDLVISHLAHVGVAKSESIVQLNVDYIKLYFSTQNVQFKGKSHT